MGPMAAKCDNDNAIVDTGEVVAATAASTLYFIKTLVGNGEVLLRLIFYIYYLFCCS